MKDGQVKLEMRRTILVAEVLTTFVNGELVICCQEFRTSEREKEGDHW